MVPKRLRESTESNPFSPSLTFFTRRSPKMLLKDASLSLVLPTQTEQKRLPLIDRRITTLVDIPKESTERYDGAIIELRIHQRYKLYLELIDGVLATMDDDFIVSPELTLQFRIPMCILRPTMPLYCDAYVSEQLSLLPIDPRTAQELRTHILLSAATVAQQTGYKTEFKLILVVRVMKIDLADKPECDRIGASIWGG